METGCLLHCLEVEETNVFEAVKQSVTTRQAALVYGISVGRNGMACCPFHDDRHPSMRWTDGSIVLPVRQMEM